MAERSNPKLAQIVLGQGRQKARVYVVIAERLLVLTKAQPLQPLRNAYRVPIGDPRKLTEQFTSIGGIVRSLFGA